MPFGTANDDDVTLFERDTPFFCFMHGKARLFVNPLGVLPRTAIVALIHYDSIHLSPPKVLLP